MWEIADNCKQDLKTIKFVTEPCILQTGLEIYDEKFVTDMRFANTTTTTRHTRDQPYLCWSFDSFRNIQKSTVVIPCFVFSCISPILANSCGCYLLPGTTATANMAPSPDYRRSQSSSLFHIGALRFGVHGIGGILCTILTELCRRWIKKTTTTHQMTRQATMTLMMIILI